MNLIPWLILLRSQMLGTNLILFNKQASPLGVAKIRIQANSGLDKSEIQIKTSYLNPIQVINRAFWPDLDPNIRCSNPIVRMSEYVMWFFNIMNKI